MPALYVSDLDGTLLDTHGHLSSTTASVLTELLAGGLTFTIASARSVPSMRGCLGDLPLQLPVVGFNGGYVSDYATGRHHAVVSLPNAAARALHGLGVARGVPVLVSTHTADEDRLYLPTACNAGVRMYLDARHDAHDPRLRDVPDTAHALDQDVTCLTLIDRREAIEATASGLESAHAEALQLHVFDDLYTPGWTWLTAHGAAATKGRAVTRIRADRGLEDHRLVVFGDQLNDLSMFTIADHAVAPSNAAPEVLRAADEVIDAHHTDAVARWLTANA